MTGRAFIGTIRRHFELSVIRLPAPETPWSSVNIPLDVI